MQGYYFNGGRNPKIEETISTLFSERLRTTVETMTRTVCFPLVEKTQTTKRPRDEETDFEVSEEDYECEEDEEGEEISEE